MQSLKILKNSVLLAAFGLLASQHANAAIASIPPAHYNSHSASCERPIKLTQDCSDWRGTMRSLVFNGYKMRVAANSSGNNVLLTSIRPAANNMMFSMSFSLSSKRNARKQLNPTVQQLVKELEVHGVVLENVVPMTRGRYVDGYYLSFSDNAYQHLKRYTVIEYSG